MNRYVYILLTIAMVLFVSCGSDKHLKKGDQFMAIGEYYEASLEYGKAYSKTPVKKKEERADVAYKVGESNRLLNNTAKAVAGYRNAIRNKHADSTIYLRLGRLLLMQRDYKGATLSYQAYLDKCPSDPEALIGMQSCAAAQAMKGKKSDYTVHEYKLFNANFDDYSPCISEDMLFFSSTRKDAVGDEMSGVTGMKNGDLYFSKKDEHGKWQRPEHIEGGLNTAYDEGACCFSADGRTMYLTVCSWDPQYPRYAQIYQCSRSDASWGKPTLCEISKDTLSNFAHPAASPDGRYLYFVSDMPGGLGGTDIWRVSIRGDRGFGAVENLGAPINTPGDERFPTFRPNGDLYYSSDGKVGLGGLDIYCAKMDSMTGKWSVDHLPVPVNSNGDDFGMTFDGKYNRGFFSSNRSNRRGWDNIYSFECPEIERSMTGWVYEQDGYELPKALVYIIGDDGTNEKIGLNLDGSFTRPLKAGVHYLYLAICEGYMNYRQHLYIPPEMGSVDTTLQFPLPSVSVPVLVRNVFYAFNKAEILPQSIPALDRLTTLLKENPSIVIELSSHCDYRGSDAYNDRLSQHRAESVVKYLTEHGIPKERVIAKGYGEKRPKVITKKFAEMYPFLHAGDTLTEAFIKRLPESQQDSCNALNRRTEFSVLKTTYGLFDENGNLKVDAVQQPVISSSQNAAPSAALKEKHKADSIARAAVLKERNDRRAAKMDSISKARKAKMAHIADSVAKANGAKSNAAKADSLAKVRRKAAIDSIARRRAAVKVDSFVNARKRQEAKRADSIAGAKTTEKSAAYRRSVLDSVLGSKANNISEPAKITPAGKGGTASKNEKSAKNNTVSTGGNTPKSTDETVKNRKASRFTNRR